MEDKDIQLIEAFFENRLTDTDKKAFEQRMADDPEFGAAVHLHGRALEAIRLSGRESLKAQLHERHPFAQMQPTSSSRWWWITGLLLLLSSGIMWWKNQQDNRPAVEPSAIPPGAPQVPPSTPIAEDSTPKPATPPKNAAPNEKQLFAAHFRPFQSNELTTMVRAGQEETPFQLFVKAYLDKKYTEALRLFETLPAEDKNNENILFLKANALLATNQTQAAIAILDKICLDKSSRYTTEAQWYLGLALLKNGDWKKAEGVFKFINTAANGQLPHAAEAGEILRAYSSSTKPAQ